MAPVIVSGISWIAVYSSAYIKEAVKIDVKRNTYYSQIL